MLINLLTAAIILAPWPGDCEVVGRLYFNAATTRDTKIPLVKALEKADGELVKVALVHVYQRPNMTPDQWRYFSIGVCVGQLDNEQEITHGRGVRRRQYFV